MGGPIFASKTGLAVWRKKAAPLEAPLIKASGGRLKLNLAVPMVVLTSLGAKSGERREVPLAYFTDGDDVILIASNYGSKRHPAWYYNLRANPKCELHIGPRGGSFVAKQVNDNADRDRLYGLAYDRLAGVYAVEDTGSRYCGLLRSSRHVQRADRSDSTAASNISADQPWAFATSPTTSPDPCSRPVASVPSSFHLGQ